jgi:hypothetical protein
MSLQLTISLSKLASFSGKSMEVLRAAQATDIEQSGSSRTAVEPSRQARSKASSGERHDAGAVSWWDR